MMDFFLLMWNCYKAHHYNTNDTQHCTLVCAVVIKLRPLYFIVYIMWKFRKLSVHAPYRQTNYVESPQLGATILADPHRQIVSCTVCSKHRSSLEDLCSYHRSLLEIYVQIIDPRWRSMFKSNQSFMSISKQGSELCSQLV